jgi:hypothetical protein
MPATFTRTVRRQRAAQTDHAASGRYGRLHIVDDLLIGIPCNLIEIFAESLAGDRNRIAIEEAALEQCLHHHIYAARIVHIFGNIIAARLEISNVRC